MDTPDDDTGSGSAKGDDGLTLAEKRLLVGLAIAGAVVLAVILLLNLFGDDSSDDAPGRDGTSAQSEPTGEATSDPAAFGDGGGIVATPEQLSPVGDPVFDELTRDTLADGPLTWKVLGEGGWSPVDGELVTDTEPAETSPLGVVEVPADLGPNWQFSIVVVAPANNAGFVFGVEDADNYWELKFNADYGAAVVNRVSDGQPAQVTTIAPTVLGEGVSWEVQHEGDTVTLAAQGEPFLALSDPSLERSRNVGVIATSGAPATFSTPQVAAIEGA